MKRNQLVGIGAMVVVAILLVIRALFFLHPQPGDGGTKIRVRFQNIDKIAKGSKVTFAGKPVGEVEKINIIQDALDIRPKGHNVIYPYELILSLDSSVSVFPTDIITAKTAGLMGERFIAIIPKALPEGDKEIPASYDDILFAYEPPSVEDTFTDISSISKKAENAFDVLATVIKKNQDSVSKTVDHMQSASFQLNELLCRINQGEIIREVSSAAKETKEFIQSLNSGKGTLGKIISSSQLYDESLQCMKNANFLTHSMASYGLFFHTNNSWKREAFLKNQPGVDRKQMSASEQTTIESRMKLIQRMREIINDCMNKKEKSLTVEELTSLEYGLKRLQEQLEDKNQQE